MGENKFLDDLAKFGNNTLSAFSGMQRQVRGWASEQVDSLIKSADLVTREEMEIRASELQKRIDALEAKIEAKLESKFEEKPEKKVKKVS